MIVNLRQISSFGESQKRCCRIRKLSCTDTFNTGLTMGRLMGTFDIMAPEISVILFRFFIVALYSYLLHQIIQEDANVVRGDAGLLHWGIAARLALLTEEPHLDNALPVHQAHVEVHLHLVGRPASSTLGAFEPSEDITDL